jgi:hypothetical protein
MTAVTADGGPAVAGATKIAAESISPAIFINMVFPPDEISIQ